ncbi:hypothetical protein ACHAXH_007803 [Discostella pseudostelligera]
MASLPPLALASSSFITTSSAFLTTYRSALRNNRRVSFVDGIVGPTSSSAMPPSKGDLYNDDELFELLTIHQTLNNFNGNQDEDSGNGMDDSILGGVHDWVLQSLNDDGDKAQVISSNGSPVNDIGLLNDNDNNPIEIYAIPNLHKFVLETIGDTRSSLTTSNDKVGDKSSINQLAFENLQTLLRDRKPSIRAIATDVDGTLLSGQYMHPITQDAILRGIQQAYDKSSGGSSSNTNKIQHFFPATGKSRKGAMDSLGPIVGPLLHNCPGVYIQGLYCVDKEGNVVFEKRLSSDAIRAAEELVAMFGLSIVGYDGDELYTTQQTDVVRDLSEIYGEPTVEVLMDKETGHSAIKLADHDRGLHKLLLMDNDVDKLALVRVSLEELAKKHDATVTQALPTMLELLPAGCSKANGVQRVCEALGINPAEELLALGDAENDLGMLQMACIGVAVGNACPLARDAADFIMKERHDEGGAGLAMNLFAFDE